MDNTDVRDQLLTELIDKMHDRLASKAYPDEKPVEEPAAPAAKTPEEDDTEMSDTDIDALLQSAE